VPTLTPNQEFLLSSLVDVAALPGHGSNLVVVGSYGRGTFNQRSAPSDLDVFVADELAVRIWDLVAAFAARGIVSRWRVAGRPDIRGVSTALHTAHPLSLAISGVGKDTKDRNLDLILPARALRNVPGAAGWMLSANEAASPENHGGLHRRAFWNLVSDEVADAILGLRRPDEHRRLHVAATDDDLRLLRNDTTCHCV
jgi:hypothetical protein